MINERLYLRKATEEDLGILFDWVNDKETRRNAFDPHIITHEEHIGWFKRMMEDPKQLQYILMDNNTACGQIRLSIYGDKAEVDYSISAAKRGCGYGQEIIRLVLERAKEDYPTVRTLIGKVKPTNTASFYCFAKNGFVEQYKQLEYDLTIEKTVPNTKTSINIVDGG